MEVGQLHKGTRPLKKSQKPNFREEYPEATTREGPEELTQRAEEKGALMSCINVDHIDANKLVPPLVDADWHACCQAIHKGIEGVEWRELYLCHLCKLHGV